MSRELVWVPDYFGGEKAKRLRGKEDNPAYSLILFSSLPF
jgi:hypothetical protein